MEGTNLEAVYDNRYVLTGAGGVIEGTLTPTSATSGTLTLSTLDPVSAGTHNLRGVLDEGYTDVLATVTIT